MTGYRVRVKSKRGIRQKFHVVIYASNGEPLFTSENFFSHSYAVKLGEETAAALGGNFQDLTK